MEVFSKTAITANRGKLTEKNIKSLLRGERSFCCKPALSKHALLSIMVHTYNFIGSSFVSAHLSHKLKLQLSTTYNFCHRKLKMHSVICHNLKQSRTTFTPLIFHSLLKNYQRTGEILPNDSHSTKFDILWLKRNEIAIASL